MLTLTPFPPLSATNTQLQAALFMVEQDAAASSALAATDQSLARESALREAEVEADVAFHRMCRFWGWG